VSIFVNPSQFGPKEDFNKYPRDLAKDEQLLKEAGVDILFYPKTEEIYPPGFDTWVVPGKHSEILEGERRPGHFRGVCTVVLNLFEIIKPDIAYFGQKDAQQFVVLNKMVLDLKMAIQMVECPIVRDNDGLALSSRNVYLNPKERETAPIFHKALLEAQKLAEKGERKREKLISEMTNIITKEPLARLDYVEIVRSDDFTIANIIDRECYILITGFIGTTRLIDNLKIDK
jgi:pantoate--beta-alanine ligase